MHTFGVNCYLIKYEFNVFAFFWFFIGEEFRVLVIPGHTKLKVDSTRPKRFDDQVCALYGTDIV